MNWLFLFVILCFARTCHGGWGWSHQRDNDEKSSDLPLEKLRHEAPLPALPDDEALPVLPDYEAFPELPAETPKPFTFGSVLEVDPDEKTIEYRIQLTEWDNLLDLSCTPMKAPFANETLYQDGKTIESNGERLELYQKIHFPFTWKRASKANFPYANLVIGGHDNTGRPFFICRAWYQEFQQIGVVSPKDGVCQLYSNGSLSRESNYDVLMNPERIRYTWVNVSNWLETPVDAFVLSRPSLTESRFIGRTILPEVGQFVLEVPSLNSAQYLAPRIKAEEPIGTPIEMGVSLQKSPSHQVLVEQSTVSGTGWWSASKEGTPEYYINLKRANVNSPKKVRLACQSTKEELNGDEFQEKWSILVKEIKGRGTPQEETVSQIEWTLYQKVSKPSLVWMNATSSQMRMDNPVFGGRDANGSDTFICRCRDCALTVDDLPYDYHGHNRNQYDYGYDPYANDYPRDIERLSPFSSIGYVSIETGLCHLPVDGMPHEVTKNQYQVLTNPSNLPVFWRNATSLTNGTIVSKLKGEPYYIGRTQNGETLTIGQVDPKRSKIYLSDGKRSFPVKVDEQVAILTVGV